MVEEFEKVLGVKLLEINFFEIEGKVMYFFVLWFFFLVSFEF